MYVYNTICFILLFTCEMSTYVYILFQNQQQHCQLVCLYKQSGLDLWFWFSGSLAPLLGPGPPLMCCTLP